MIKILIHGTPEEIEEIERLMKTLQPGIVIPYDPKIGITIEGMKAVVEKHN